MTDSKKIVEILIGCGAIALSPLRPFTYASGLEGPIYCDNRKILSFPKDRNIVVEAFLALIKNSGLEFDLLCGLATAGIPHASFLADRLERPMIYIRSSNKSHGKKNLIEGVFKNGDKTLLVEDLVNQGSSLEKAILAAREAGLEVTDCISIVSYSMEKAQRVLEQTGVKLHSLVDFFSLCDHAKSLGKIDEREYDLLKAWQSDPANWQA